MISYSWAQQALVKRIRAALGDRDYRVWLVRACLRACVRACV
jgi:hypothetical protein